MPRRAEVIAGVASGLIGVASLAYFVFGPTYRYSECGAAVATQPSHSASPAASDCVNGTASLIQAGAAPQAWILLAVMLLCLIGVAVGAYLDGEKGVRAGLGVLWVSSILLILGTVIGIFSVGLFLAVPALLGLVATIIGTAARASPAAPVG